MSRSTRLLAALTLTAGAALAAAPAIATPDGTSMSQPGRHTPRIVQQWANAWNTADPVAMSKLFARDGTYTDHAFQASFTGPAGARQWGEITRRAISPLKVTIHDTIVDGDRIAITWTFSGTFTTHHPFAPYNPAGKSFAVPATTILTLHHHRLTSAADYYNLADLLRQLNLPAGPFTPPSAP
ncbi:SnoaL-like domain-containing protein [Kribbella sandramycini]|uniref:SnoaL-like domain-containing protein n=1 Tax=Kribbella sandramycini TaxID=60450 RepID=A0A7Y4KVN0_9ACTN|nr:ester cyclase [Kribbella sandramycini]MBB6567991.1 steroid delta-isomerase-like uncharacterized protein [Kribbella sandramycini]NOL39415.1 SnoaL-like domain-containing protein [Kribbella sandramycini]